MVNDGEYIYGELNKNGKWWCWVLNKKAMCESTYICTNIAAKHKERNPVIGGSALLLDHIFGEKHPRLSSDFQWIGLRENWNRKTPYFMGKSMISGSDFYILVEQPG